MTLLFFSKEYSLNFAREEHEAGFLFGTLLRQVAWLDFVFWVNIEALNLRSLTALKWMSTLGKYRCMSKKMHLFLEGGNPQKMNRGAYLIGHAISRFTTRLKLDT